MSEQFKTTAEYSQADRTIIDLLRRAMPPGTPDALAVAKSQFDFLRAGSYRVVEFREVPSAPFVWDESNAD